MFTLVVLVKGHPEEINNLVWCYSYKFDYIFGGIQMIAILKAEQSVIWAPISPQLQNPGKQFAVQFQLEKSRQERASCRAGKSSNASPAPTPAAAPLPALPPPKEVASLLLQNGSQVPKWHLLNKRFAFYDFPPIFEWAQVDQSTGHIRVRLYCSPGLKCHKLPMFCIHKLTLHKRVKIGIDV